MKLNEKAMLVALHTTGWNPQITDRPITDEVAQKHRVARSAGKYVKRLLPARCPEFEAVEAARRALRAYHNSVTLPWAQDAVRLMPAAIYFDYSAEMRKLRDALHAAVTDLAAALPTIKARAQAELGSLYSGDNYPADVARLYSDRISVLPLPDGADFRVTLNEEAVAEIRDNIERDVSEQVQVAHRDLYDRLLTAVSRAAERLADPEAVFRDSLIGNLRELCALLPKLNLTGDQNLDAAVKEVDAALANRNPEILRENATARADAARAAADIERRMRGLMGGA